ncbi:hypothetical protein [Desulfitobacterium hafniense]|uniref:hypothetical protein n=1 Tax=Desulfitobacterium hafniense TaxID=49338 RepID=UPI0002FC664C|nr:hypothetical protein [Desulfitobacterium hafniense]
MSYIKDIQIIPGKGYHELWVDREHQGNYDSMEDLREDLNLLEEQKEAINNARTA